MKLRLSWIFAPIVLFLFLPAQLAATTFQQDEGRHQALSDNQITIRVHNYARAKPVVLRRAEQFAGDVLREAGIETNWVECGVGENPSSDAACARPVTALDLILNLLPRHMARRSSLRGEVFGVAMESENDFGFYSSVYYDKVKDFASHERLDLPPLLGHVIAHELGHLLMGTHSHMGHGLMCASWSGKHFNAAERRGLNFSSSETQRLQIAMMTRKQATVRGAANRESRALDR